MGEKCTPLEEYLRQMAMITGEMRGPELSVHGYVLRNGRRFESEPLTREEWDYIDLSEWRMHPPKQCYRNAQMAAGTLPRREGMALRYAEGFVDIGLGIGINHVWLSLNGKVVDTTTRIDRRRRNGGAANRPMGVFPEGWEYYGVELDPAECEHSVIHDGMGPLIDDWLCGWPLLAREAAGPPREEMEEARAR